MIDRYTKSMLTVIAVCLIWLSVKDFAAVGPAVAQSPQPVYITGINIPDNEAPGGFRFRFKNNALPVRQMAQ